MPVPKWKTKKGKIEAWLENDPEARKWFDTRQVAAKFSTSSDYVAAIISELVLNNWNITRSMIDLHQYQVRETSRERAKRLQAKEKNA